MELPDCPETRACAEAIRAAGDVLILTQMTEAAYRAETDAVKKITLLEQLQANYAQLEAAYNVSMDAIDAVVLLFRDEKIVAAMQTLRASCEGILAASSARLVPLLGHRGSA